MFWQKMWLTFNDVKEDFFQSRSSHDKTFWVYSQIPRHSLYTACRALDISQTASYEITLVCLSICLSICPSLKTGLLVFSDVVDDDSWPWYLATDEARFWKKNFFMTRPTSLNQFQNEVFHHYLVSESLVFLEIACIDSLQQCLRSSRGKFMKKNRRFKFGSKLGFSSFSQVWFVCFPGNCIGW